MKVFFDTICRRPLPGCSGFTLLELLIVVAIISTLVSIALPSYQSLLASVRKNDTLTALKGIEKQILLFETSHGRLPETLAEAGITETDQWGNPYQYTPIRGKPLTGPDKVRPRKDKFLHPINSDYDLWSMGPDGRTNRALTAAASHDDIIRASDGTFFGNAEDY